MAKIDILGVKIDQITEKEVLEKIPEFIRSGTSHQIVTCNPEFVMLAQEDKDFLKIINQASLVLPDGIGILWAAKFLSIRSSISGVRSQVSIIRYLQISWQAFYTLLSLIFYPSYLRTVLPSRIAGSDLIWKISELASQNQYSIFLLGGGEGVALKAAMRLQQRFPTLRVAGSFSGRGEEFGDRITVPLVKRRKPEILFVAYGLPKQEKWIKRNLGKLKEVKIAVGVGGAFDFITGTQRRAPKIFQKLSLEWFWRTATKPKRISRTTKSVPRFIAKVVKYKIEKRDMR